MSKPISFGFGKPKGLTTTASKPSVPKPISLPLNRPTGGVTSRPAKGALQNDSDDEDDIVPQAEAVTGFTSSGAILSKPQQEKQELVIANSGNGDWRRRGRTNLLPAEVQAAQAEAHRNGGDIVTVERNEVSTASGLQFADPTDVETNTSNANDPEAGKLPEKELTEDERALRALLEDGTGKPKSTAVIETQGNIRLQQRDETEDFRADVAARPESATLEDYAAMPVEEFGMAMLRGMGQKRRANGEVIKLDSEKEKDSTKKQRKQEGFLGIGAKPAPGLEGVELGAWGKTEMRKNNKGQGFFTPVMMEDKRTGERISEEEFERRKREAKAPKKGEDDWRNRRDRNLERNGRNNDEEDTNGSRKRHRDDGDRGSKSKSSKDRDDRRYDSSRSKRDRSRERDRRKRDDNDDDVGSGSGRDRDRHRDRDGRRDDDRYESSSSRRSEYRERDRDRDHDRDRARDKDRERDRDDRRNRDRR